MVRIMLIHRDISIYLIQLGVIHNLLIAAGNASHPDSQRQAGIALEVFHDKKNKYLLNLQIHLTIAIAITY